jgi:hypothetical protein
MPGKAPAADVKAACYMCYIVNSFITLSINIYIIFGFFSLPGKKGDGIGGERGVIKKPDPGIRLTADFFLITRTAFSCHLKYIHL